MFTTQYTHHITLSSHDPGLAPPLIPYAAGHYLEVRVKYLNVLLRPGHPQHEVVPTQFLKTALLAPRRSFLALGPTSFRSVLANMGAAGIPASFIDSLGPDMLRLSRSIAENPVAAAAKVLSLCLYVVAETMTLASASEVRARRKAKAYVDSLEEVIVKAGDDDQCTICLEEFGAFDDRDHKVVRTPCSHVYHKACIARWLRTSQLCPLCRYAMPIS